MTCMSFYASKMLKITHIEIEVLKSYLNHKKLA
jgi:hypothetical protein